MAAVFLGLSLATLTAAAIGDACSEVGAPCLFPVGNNTIVVHDRQLKQSNIRCNSEKVCVDTTNKVEISTGIWVPSSNRLPPLSNYTAERIVVLGDDHSKLGIYDPAIQPVNGGMLVMSYSSVPQLSLTEIQVAVSADGGGSWELASKVSAVRNVTIQCPTNPSGRCNGFMVDEVSFVFNDPTDPDPARQWKVLTHSWFYSPAKPASHFQWGYISLYTSNSLTNKQLWARESLLGWTTPPSLHGMPVSHVGVHQNLTDIAELAHCMLFSEPSVVIRSDIIYLALGCVFAHQTPTGNYVGQIDIVLLRSTDHAHSFEFVSTLLSGTDALSLGWTERSFNGGNLFVLPGCASRNSGTHTNSNCWQQKKELQQEVYLLASPSGNITLGDQNFTNYLGCAVFRVSDLERGLLERNNGLPTVYRYMEVNQDRTKCGACGSGACTYAGSTRLGYVSNAFVDPLKPWWQVAATPFFAP